MLYQHILPHNSYLAGILYLPAVTINVNHKKIYNQSLFTVMKLLRFLFFLFCAMTTGIPKLLAQESFSFAHVTDTHIGSDKADEDLRRTVHDINQNKDIQFVIVSGDVTEFGSDNELRLAKQILDSLTKPYYIIPGNHDDNWSESGTNSFKKTFGAETFFFKYGKYYFLGNDCGPNMKMSPGQVPYNHIVWMDSVLKIIQRNAPVIFINHYPLDSSVNNWYEIADRLKKQNTQLYIHGHLHNNGLLSYEGIPAIKGRSNLRAKDSTGAYNIVTFKNDSAFYQNKRPGLMTDMPWARVQLKDHNFANDTVLYNRPSYSINMQYPGVKELYRYQNNADIGNGFVLYNNFLITPDAAGKVSALDLNKKSIAWTYTASGKIYSTPALSGTKLLITCTDGNLYCLNAINGKLLWTYKTSKAIVASPLVTGANVYFGSSEGLFRCVDINTGKLKWQFNEVKGFVKSTPVYNDGHIYIGGWGNEFYCLNAVTGALTWKYNSGYANRMLSAASCLPVASGNKLFLVAPDRFMTVLHLKTGAVLWKHKWDDSWVRESIGISEDKKTIYAKAMQGHLIAVDATADSAVVKWKSNNVFGYELNPSVITERAGIVYVMSDKGVLAAFDKTDGAVKWVHKISNTLVHDIKFVSEKKIAATTMDGKIVLLQIP